MTVRFVTYHYVRDPGEHFPGIPAVDRSTFVRDVQRLTDTHDSPSRQAFFAWLAGNADTVAGRDWIVFTFDDGLADHRWAAEMLADAGVLGMFFASAAPLETSGRLLEVHRIQHLLGAAGVDHRALHAELLGLVAPIAGRDGVPSIDALRAAHERPSRFDGPETRFVKKLLQFALPAAIRVRLLDELFERHSPQAESEIAAGFYLDASDLHTIAGLGHVVGGHGLQHRRLSEIDETDVEAEVVASREMVRRVHPDLPWTYCYAFGDRDPRSIERLRALDCAAAFTVVPADADLAHRLELSRYDCNDIEDLLALCT